MIYSVYTSPIWRIKKIEVFGNENITNSELLGLAEISSETTLLKFDREKIINRLRKNPWVRDVEFGRKLPNTLIVRLEEKKPVVKIIQADKVYLIDKYCRVITALSINDKSTESYPAVNGLNVKSLRNGKLISSKLLKEAVKILSHLPPDIDQRIVSISVPKLSKIALYTGNNVEIIYGPATLMKKKNKIITALLQKKQIIYINVTIPEKPATRRL